jgi:hypothetical protein
VGDDGALVPIHGHRPGLVAPLGSIFKLYVLGALVESVRAGDLSWDDPVTIAPGDASFAGSVDTQPGATLPLRRLATLMVARSDNHAADAIARLVGRSAIEAVLEPMGMGAASRRRTLPFLSAREAFVLKWGSQGAEYAAADVRGRRAILAELDEPVPNPVEVDLTMPAAVDRSEWFATPAEVARAHLWLDAARHRSDGEALEGVLVDENPGLELLDHDRWSGGAFKGGSEPGVLSLSWRLDRADGRRFVLVVVWSSGERTVDEAEGRAVALAAIDLLAAA